MDFAAERQRLQEAMKDPASEPLPPVRPYRDDDPHRVRLARHEAGHAVVGVLLGRALLDVRLTPSGGLCTYDLERSEGDLHRPAITLAGIHGDFTQGRRPLSNYHFSDARRAAAYWIEDEPERWSGWTVEDLLRAERVCVQRLLDRHQSAVDCLARYLQAHGQIDGVEAEEMLLQHGVKPLPEPPDGRPAGWTP
jgi:hypothetical protein